MFGVYVHFPYCRSKCPYCDFAVHVERKIPHTRYANAVLRELELRASEFEPKVSGADLRSIFFGGGTPSLWEVAELGRVFAALVGRFGGSSAQTELEVTLEVNPDDLDLEAFRARAAAGVNRVSIGVQSFDDAVLRGLGRAHSADRAKAAIADALAAGFNSVSVDLIFGGPGQSPELAERDADTAAALGVQHVSAYGLTLDELAVDVPLARRVRAGKVRVADADGQADMGQAVRAALSARGFRRYEISNFALAGHESRHNLGYWAGETYLGLGVGAYGATETLRYGNPRGLDSYLEPLEAGALPMGEQDPLDEATRFRERVFLGLRRVSGLDLDALERQFGPSKVASLRSARFPGLLEQEGATLRFTDRGLDVHSELCARLL